MTKRSSTRKHPLKPCGTVASYRRGCRCDLCRKAAADKKRIGAAEYKRRWRAESNGAYLRTNRSSKHSFMLLLRDLGKARPCVDCGGRFPGHVMDYDHLPGCEKLDKVGMIPSRSTQWRDITVEIAKCEVVCANCHRTRTYNRKMNYK